MTEALGWVNPAHPCPWASPPGSGLSIRSRLCLASDLIQRRCSSPALHLLCATLLGQPGGAADCVPAGASQMAWDLHLRNIDDCPSQHRGGRFLFWIGFAELGRAGVVTGRGAMTPPTRRGYRRHVSRDKVPESSRVSTCTIPSPAAKKKFATIQRHFHLRPQNPPFFFFFLMALASLLPSFAVPGSIPCTHPKPASAFCCSRVNMHN